MILLQWMGMNALIIYALAACELFPAAVQGFYWRLPENNLVIFLSLLLFQWVFIHTHRHMRTHTHKTIAAWTGKGQMKLIYFQSMNLYSCRLLR